MLDQQIRRRFRRISRALVLGMLVAGSSAGFGAAGEGGNLAPNGGQDAHHHRKHDAVMTHRFDDIERWVRLFEDPERKRWQRPQEVVDFLSIEKEQIVVDIGAGTGYFSVLFAEAVGPQGKVLALDVEEGMVDYVNERARRESLGQLLSAVVPPDDPAIPDPGADLVFVCDTWHHIDDRIAYLAKIRSKLRPGGRLAIVDFREGELPVGPPAGHKLSREDVLSELKTAGWTLAEEMTDLPYQYVLVFRPND